MKLYSDFSSFGLSKEPSNVRASEKEMKTRILRDFARDGLFKAVSELDGLKAEWDPAGYGRFTIGHHLLGVLALEWWDADWQEVTRTGEPLPSPLKEARDWEIREHRQRLASFCITDFGVQNYKKPPYTGQTENFLSPRPLKNEPKAAHDAYQKTFQAYQESLAKDNKVLLHESYVEENGKMRTDYINSGRLFGDKIENKRFEKGSVVLIDRGEAYRCVSPAGQVMARLTLHNMVNTTYDSFYARPGVTFSGAAYRPMNEDSVEKAKRQLMPIIKEHYPRKMENAVTLPLNELDSSLRENIYEAMRASERAFPADKKTKVGCVIVGRDENEQSLQFSGANIKRKPWKETTHAEEAAIIAAIGGGMEAIDKIFLYGTVDELCCPCGSCVDMLLEHDDPENSAHVYMTSGGGESVTITKLSDILRFIFKG